jgi:hypothetical protein
MTRMKKESHLTRLLNRRLSGARLEALISNSAKAASRGRETAPPLRSRQGVRQSGVNSNSPGLDVVAGKFIRFVRKVNA